MAKIKIDPYVKSVALNILRVALPLIIIVLGLLPGSYLSYAPVSTDGTHYTLQVVGEHTYFDLQIMMGDENFQGGNFAPMITMLLAISCLVTSTVSLFVDKEILLTIALHSASLGIIASIYSLLLQTLTWMGWAIAGVFVCQVVVLSVLMMEKEDRSRRGR